MFPSSSTIQVPSKDDLNCGILQFLKPRKSSSNFIVHHVNFSSEDRSQLYPRW
ncbi:hypothetical protein Hanom_Chr04g00365801 [Helianthus anomalus]